ncbi:MAG TPA: DUF4446 family protein [Actinomycetota bacterium]
MDKQTIMTTAALAVAAVAILLALSSHRQLARSRRSLLMLQGTFEGRTLIDAVSSFAGQVRGLEADLEQTKIRQQELIERLASSKRNVGIVRFDAFEDMGGLMSFSAAFLDDHQTGIVITAINGRTEGRIYAKAIEEGRSSHNLSPEEQRALIDALGGQAKVSP